MSIMYANETDKQGASQWLITALTNCSIDRLPERARKTAVGPMKHLSPVGADSVSWTELSSISSARISTISEPNNSRLGAQTAAAQRDYRFQAYKCPQNFVLPELTKEGEDRVKTCDTSLVSSKKSGAEIVIVEKSDSRSSPQRNKWSNVSDELQSNRLFVSEQFELNYIEYHAAE